MLASANISMVDFASALPTETDHKIALKRQSTKVKSCSLEFQISCRFLKEGKATYGEVFDVLCCSQLLISDLCTSDADMQSYASQMSLNDLGSLEDLTDNCGDSDLETDRDIDVQRRLSQVETQFEERPGLTVNGTDTVNNGKVQEK